jgi:sortase A
VRRRSRILSTALITAGLVVLTDAGLTLVWQEPVSAAWSAIQQSRASDQLDQLEADFPSAEDIAALGEVRGDAARARILAKSFAKEIDEGDPIGRIVIPSIDLDMVLMQGTDTATLQRGPGHYPDTALPGLGGVRQARASRDLRAGGLGSLAQSVGVARPHASSGCLQPRQMVAAAGDPA